MKTIRLSSKNISATTRIIQISDSHLIVVDEKDKINFEKQKARKKFFENETRVRTGQTRFAEEEIANAVAYAKTADLTVFTGDIIEFPTPINVDKMMEYFTKLDNYMYIFGNHDYSDYTLVESDSVQYERNLGLFTDRISNDLEFAKKEINGIYVVLMDNSRFQFTERQYDELVKIFAEGKEAILCMHIPLFHPLLDVEGQKRVNVVADTCGMSKELNLERGANATTKAVIELIKKYHEQVVAILVGHNHFDAIIPYYENVVEYVCGPAYLGDFYEFIITRERGE